MPDRPRSLAIAGLMVFTGACGNNAQTVSDAGPPNASALAASASAPSPSDSLSLASSQAVLPIASVVIVGTPPEIDAACREYADLVCHREEACGRALLQLRHLDFASCARIETRTCEADLAPPASGAVATTIHTCAIARTASCAALLGDLPSECRLAGTIQDGAPCVQNAQCVGGFCDRDPDKRCGTCRHVAELHQPCTRGSVCDWGFVCISGACQKRPALGESCSPALRCDGPLECAKGQCVSPAEESQPCSPTGSPEPSCDRRAGLVCDSTSKKCAPAKISKLGESCANAAVCAFGTYCGIKKTCEKNARDGDPCGPNGPFCESPSLCVGGVSTLLDPANCK